MNKEMKNINLELLQTIKKVEAPPFLLTRIQERIRRNREQNFSPQMAWALSFAVAFVFVSSSIIGFIQYRQKTAHQRAALLNYYNVENYLYQ